MNIRFPKKNIAQHQADRFKKESLPKEPEPEPEVRIVKSEPKPDLTEIPFFSLGTNVNKLYPTRLHRLHEDLELLGRLNTFPSEQAKRIQKELSRRLPSSLPQAEAKADRMIEEFVRNVVKIQGQEQYTQRLKEAMTDQIQIMLALRCWIAAKTIETPRNTIKIFRNKVMNSWEFFPESARTTTVDPKTGEQQIYINYETDENAPYKRQQEVISRKHYQIGEVKDPGPKKIDQMPQEWGQVMSEVLLNFGYEVDSIRTAWDILEEVSRDSTIEERILSKIAYLITHANVHKKNKELPG